jgi:hypothetical protein
MKKKSYGVLKLYKMFDNYNLGNPHLLLITCLIRLYFNGGILAARILFASSGFEFEKKFIPLFFIFFFDIFSKIFFVLQNVLSIYC